MTPARARPSVVYVHNERNSDGHAAGRGRARLCATGFLTLAVPLLTVGAGAAQAEFPGANGPIAFTVQKWRQPAGVTTSPPMPHACPEAEGVWVRTETGLPGGRGRGGLRALDKGLGGKGAGARAPKGRV